MMVQIVLKRAANGKADDFMVQDFAKCGFPSPAERVATRCDHDKTDRSDRKGLKLFGRIDSIRYNTDVCAALGDRPHDLSARAILEFNVDIGVS